MDEAKKSNILFVWAAGCPKEEIIAQTCVFLKRFPEAKIISFYHDFSGVNAPFNYDYVMNMFSQEEENEIQKSTTNFYNLMDKIGADKKRWLPFALLVMASDRLHSHLVMIKKINQLVKKNSGRSLIIIYPFWPVLKFPLSVSLFQFYSEHKGKFPFTLTFKKICNLFGKLGFSKFLKNNNNIFICYLYKFLAHLTKLLIESITILEFIMTIIYSKFNDLFLKFFLPEESVIGEKILINTIAGNCSQFSNIALNIMSALKSNGYHPIFISQDSMSCKIIREQHFETINIPSIKFYCRNNSEYRIIQESALRMIDILLDEVFNPNLIFADYNKEPSSVEYSNMTEFSTRLKLYAYACIIGSSPLFWNLYQILISHQSKVIIIREVTSDGQAIAEMAEKCRCRTIGIESIMHPDFREVYKFGAQLHLVYGRHLTERLVRHYSLDSSTIKEVGSLYYEACLNRNQAADFEYCRKLLPEWREEKLVILATENRHQQMLEIEPTLKALNARKDVYVVIKKHPSEPEGVFEQFYGYIGSPRHMKVISICDLHALLNASDLILTNGSNVVIEAAVMGRISLSYNYTGGKNEVDFVRDGLCLGISSPQECLKVMDEIFSKGPKYFEARAKLKNIGYYNAYNDGKTLQRIIDEIINF